MNLDRCTYCLKFSSSLFLESGAWICRWCLKKEVSNAPYFKEMGHANPHDPKGSTAHISDIRDRRWHPEEKRLFYYSKEKPKRYFFMKG